MASLKEQSNFCEVICWGSLIRILPQAPDFEYPPQSTTFYCVKFTMLMVKNKIKMNE